MISVKKENLEHPEACSIKKSMYQSKIDSFMQQGYSIVYAHKSSFEAETISLYGYAPIGRHCIDNYKWEAKKQTNIIVAFYGKMLFALDHFEHNINSTIFYHWFKQTLIPSLKTKCVIVMDMIKDKALLCPSVRRELCSSNSFS